MTEMAIEKIEIPRYCHAEVALHKEETAVFSKSEINLLWNIDYINLSCGVLFPHTPLKKYREMAFAKMARRLFTESGAIHSKQPVFYMNVSYTQLESSKSASVGDKVSFGTTYFASPNPNDVRNGLGNSVVFEIANNDKLLAAALPSPPFNAPLYIFPLSTTFQVTNIRMEKWVCGLRLSCPKVHSKVKVITLESI